MTTEHYDSLADMGRIKESLMSVFGNTENITKLVMPVLDNNSFTHLQNWYGGVFFAGSEASSGVRLIGHCFDVPYSDGILTDKRCAIFIETCITKIANRHIKEVGVDISVICHKDLLYMSEEETEYFNAAGIYGNRIDSTVQAINSTIMSADTENLIKELYSVGSLILSEKDPVRQCASGSEFYGKCLSYTYQSFYHRKNHI